VFDCVIPIEDAHGIYLDVGLDQRRPQLSEVAATEVFTAIGKHNQSAARVAGFLHLRGGHVYRVE